MPTGLNYTRYLPRMAADLGAAGPIGTVRHAVCQMGCGAG